MRHLRLAAYAVAAAVASASTPAFAQPTEPASPEPEDPRAREREAEPVVAPPPPPPRAETKEPDHLVTITPLGYVEGHYAYNFNRPSNGITNYRGFDNRHNTFTLANAVLGAAWEGGPLSGRVVLQVGSTPSSYYLGEPSSAGTGGVNATNAELWKYLQEAFVAYRAPVGRGLVFQLGLVASPIGFESFAVKDNWCYSRSNLFFGLPYYHAGLRVSYAWTDALSTTLSVFNGWNSVVDNNEEKSIQANVTYRVPDSILLQAGYFGGVERSTGSPEGPYHRHHFDFVGQVDATPWLAFAGQADFGWEPNRIGTARWFAAALYARARPLERVFITVRGDRFHEHLATDGAGRSSSPLFWNGVEWVTSGTLSFDVRPHDHLSIRLEGRHDVAASPLYFGRNVQGDGRATPWVANARTQDTLLLGATAWF